MSENLKAAAYAAGLSESDKKKVDSLSKLLTVHKELSNLPSDLAQRQAAKYTPAQQDSLVKVMGNEDPITKPSRGALGTAWHYTGGQIGNLGGNRTLANPSNLTAGQSGSIFIVQDATGSRTLAYGNQYDFIGGTAPTLSTAANAVDRIDYVVRTTGSIHCVFTANYS